MSMTLRNVQTGHEVVLWLLLTTGDLHFFNLFNFYCFSDLELKPVGILEVKLVQAKELTNKDVIGKSDPYAELYIRPLRDRMKTSKIIVSLFLITFWDKYLGVILLLYCFILSFSYWT